MPYKDYEKRLEYSRRYRKKYPEKVKETKKCSNHKHREKNRRYEIRYRIEHPEYNKNKCKVYYLNHRDKCLENVKLYQQKIQSRYSDTMRTHMRRGLEFDVTLKEYEAKDIVGVCGLCGISFGVGGWKKVWEYDYREFWHHRCNLFKGKMNRKEFEQFLLNCHNYLLCNRQPSQISLSS